MDFKVINNKVKIVFVKFEDEAAWRIAMQNNRLASENRWVPVEKVQASFSINNFNQVLSVPSFH